MGLFKKKPVYTPPVRNDRPVQLRYNVEKDTYREEATIIVDNKLQNKNGVPTEWLTFPKYYDYREEPNYKEHFDTMHGGNIGVEIDW